MSGGTSKASPAWQSSGSNAVVGSFGIYPAGADCITHIDEARDALTAIDKHILARGELVLTYTTNPKLK